MQPIFDLDELTLAYATTIHNMVVLKRNTRLKERFCNL
jgi:hypothetical protein